MSYPLSIKRDLQDVAAAQSDVSVIAAVAGRRLRILALVVTADTAATTITFESGTATGISGTLDVAPNDPLVLPEFQLGWFETAAGEAFTVNTGAGGGVTLQTIYAEV